MCERDATGKHVIIETFKFLGIEYRIKASNSDKAQIFLVVIIHGFIYQMVIELNGYIAVLDAIVVSSDVLEEWGVIANNLGS